MHILCSWSSESSASKISQNCFSLGYSEANSVILISGHATALSCSPLQAKLNRKRVSWQGQKGRCKYFIATQRCLRSSYLSPRWTEEKSIRRFSRSIYRDDAPKWRRNSQWAEKVLENCKTKNEQTRFYPHRERCHQFLLLSLIWATNFQ
jgi:hypothetical protein